MKKRVIAAKPAQKQATIEQWQRLYAVAATLKDMAPWRALWDSDIVTIQLRDQKEPTFCSVMGQGGECYGIGVYPGFDAFTRLSRLMSADADTPNGINIFEQNCLMCYYGDREEIDPRDRAVMQELGLKFRGKNQWIFFRSLAPGHIPWFLNGAQVALLTDALENLFMACAYVLRGEIQVDFEGGETLLRFYSGEREDWLNAAVPMPMIPTQRMVFQVEDELLLARLKKSKKSQRTIELDSFYLPMPIQEGKEDCPYLPRMAILADRQDGLLLDQHILESGERPEHVVFDMLLRFIGQYGRPAIIYVRDDQMACLLEKTCEEIGVALKPGEGMPAIDEFFEGMMEGMP